MPGRRPEVSVALIDAPCARPHQQLVSGDRSSVWRAFGLRSNAKGAESDDIDRRHHEGDRQACCDQQPQSFRHDELRCSGTTSSPRWPHTALATRKTNGDLRYSTQAASCLTDTSEAVLGLSLEQRDHLV